MKNDTLSAMLLVAGMCVGGGMLVLPVASGVSGFLPSVLVMLMIYVAMTLSGLLLMEVSLWMDEGAHVISMVSKYLGPAGRGVAWVLFLFISYASIVAYVAGGGGQFQEAVRHFSGITLSKFVASCIFLTLFGFVVDFGSHFVGRVNSLLFVGMVGAYCCMIVLGIDEIKPALLFYQNWNKAFLAIPLVLASFSFQTIVPSLVPLLQRDPKSLKWAIVGGTSIALLIYVIWQMLILGIIPLEGTKGLLYALEKGDPATMYIKDSAGGVWVGRAADFFAFFAIVTSFLGITLSLFDFLADGLKIEKKGAGKAVLVALIVVPTLFFSTYLERAFLMALDASGAYGDTILNGIIPVLMVWVGRYHWKERGPFQLFGGKFLLGAIGLFFGFLLGMEILKSVLFYF